MKTKILAILIEVIIPSFCHSQAEIRDIDKSVQNIKDNLLTFVKVEKINSKEGTNFVFLKDKDIKLVTVKALEPRIEKNVEWHFVDGELAYTETNWLDIATKNNIFSERCYFHNGHLISWENSRDKIIAPTSAAFKKMDAKLVAYGIKIKDDALK